MRMWSAKEKADIVLEVLSRIFEEAYLWNTVCE